MRGGVGPAPEAYSVSRCNATLKHARGCARAGAGAGRTVSAPAPALIYTYLSDGATTRERPAVLDAAAALEAPIKEMLVRGLVAIDGVQVFGSVDLADRVGTVAFRVRDLDPAAVALALGELGVCVGNGHFYALLPCAALGVLETGGVVRASIASYTSASDVQRLLDGVAAIAAAGGK